MFIRIRCISSQFFIQFIQQIHSLHFHELLELAFLTFNLRLNTFIILHLLSVSIEFLCKRTLHTIQNIFEPICANPLVVETIMIIVLLRSPITNSIKTIAHIIRLLRRIEFNRVIAKFTSDDQLTRSTIEIGLTNNHISSFFCSRIKRNTNFDFTLEKVRRTISLLCTCRIIHRNQIFLCQKIILVSLTFKRDFILFVYNRIKLVAECSKYSFFVFFCVHI